MNKLDLNKRAQILSCLVEGNSIRATCRMTGAAKNTVVKVLADVGTACAAYQEKALRNLPCKRVQIDEIWSFAYAKQKSVESTKAAPESAGDAWTWTALCADTKLVVSWMVGAHDSGAAHNFIQDLSDRLASRIELTSDGNRLYVDAVEGAFGGDIDYSMLIQIFGEQPKGQQRKYSPAECLGAEVKRITGKPDMAAVNTSYVERQNLTMRMSMRRFTRLANAFSKKLENLARAVALHFMHYNFARIHQTLSVTPAMEAGIADHVWSLEEIAALVEQ